jgi:uncharacterized repeat protein (TIGR03943 family)
VNSRTQGLVLAVVAAVLIRLSVTGEYLRFVTPWMRWPLLAAGLILLAMAVRPAMGWIPATSHATAPRTAWLLFLPVLVVFVVSPPPLGAFLAERRATQAPSLADPIAAPLPETSGPALLSVGEFVWGVSQKDDPIGISARRVTMTGFVSGTGDNWYVTQLQIACCAADATVARVKVTGHDSPPRDQWVEVTGTWLEGSGLDGDVPATVVAEQVVEIDAPREMYG